MKRILSTLILAVVIAAGASAQVKVGFFSYEEAFHSIPGYAIAQTSLRTLREQYEAEMHRVEEDFNAKFEDFLDHQKELAPAIRQKRQMELQLMMERNVSFREEMERLMAEAEADAYKPLRDKISQVLFRIGQEKGLDFILNTDSNAWPYISPETGIDLNEEIKAALQE